MVEHLRMNEEIRLAGKSYRQMHFCFRTNAEKLRCLRDHAELVRETTDVRSAFAYSTHA